MVRLDATPPKPDITTMHFAKLFLATSFAAAAALRGGVTLLTGAEFPQAHGMLALLAGQSGAAIEMAISLAAGALLARRVSSTKRRKATIG